LLLLLPQHVSNSNILKAKLDAATTDRHVQSFL